MTPEQEAFRSNDTLRAELRDIIQSDIFIRARLLIEGVAKGKDVGLDATELSSVRLLSTRCARESVFMELEELTTPPEQPLREHPDDFGHPDEVAKLEDLYQGPK